MDWRRTFARVKSGPVPTTERILLASIHDVSPRFEGEIDRLVDLLDAHVGKRIAMLVVPNHWGDAPIVRASAFATRLRAWAEGGFEMFLHGYFHRDDAKHESALARARAMHMTAGEGEFLGLSREAASARIAEGRALIEDVIGRPVDGFVAPAWLYGRGALEALAHSEVPIAEDHLRVWSPRHERDLARGPVISWASRTPLRLASSLVAAAAVRRLPMRVLRVGVHPPDIHHASLVRSIDKTLSLAAASRRPGRYSDLLS
jgi:predicted deacetylase